MCFETHNNKNLQILQAQSKLIVEKLENDKSKASDHAYVTGQLENMTKTYEQEAKGPNKHQILSDYMKVFCPMVYGINKGKEAQLRKQEQKNKQLNDQLAKLKEKQGKCCVVM